MIKILLINKKNILILNDAKNKIEINNVVPINIINSRKENIVIVTTQNSKIVKNCPIKFYIIDIKELNGNTSLRLFINHSSRVGDKLPKELVEFGKQIMQSYNRLSLNLNVIDASLG
uniref:Uncharacterized protein n=1 Tax=Physcomitrium patens TaxID=3218 RepID=A0A2K1IW40_PHYPA|nr:hypothetical protein PHYPA_025434 [Physcomitrium patens]